MTCLRGLLLMLGLLVVQPAWAGEPSWVTLGDHVGADDVTVVLGEDAGGLWLLAGEVRRQLGRPVQGMTLEIVDPDGVRRYVDAGVGLVGGDLSCQGELALVTLDGTVLVGQPEGLQPLALGDLFVTQARWDPEGRQLAITAWSGGARPWGVHTAATVEDLVRALDCDVHVVDEAGRSRQLTHGPKQDYNPVWSPDGQQVMFVSLRTSYASLFLADAAGASVTQLTNFGAERGAPAIPVPLSDRCWWNDDQILYETATAAGEPEIWQMTLDGRASRLGAGSVLGVIEGGVGILRTADGWQTLDAVGEGRLP